MYTHLHSVEWNYDKNFSHDDYAYYHNSVDGRYVCEYRTKFGFEYYICSDIQTQKSLLGEYIGCFVVDTEQVSNVLVVDHDSETEKTLSLNDQKYLVN